MEDFEPEKETRYDLFTKIVINITMLFLFAIGLFIGLSIVLLIEDAYNKFH